MLELSDLCFLCDAYVDYAHEILVSGLASNSDMELIIFLQVPVKSKTTQVFFQRLCFGLQSLPAVTSSTLSKLLVSVATECVIETRSRTVKFILIFK